MTALLANQQDLEALADKSAHLMQQVLAACRARPPARGCRPRSVGGRVL